MAILMVLGACTPRESYLKEVQLTNDGTKHHDLDDNHNFSPDGKWLAYDTRTDEGGIADSKTIERVNIETGEIDTLLDIVNNRIYGPGAGVVSYHPKENRVIFIHGLANCTADYPYEQWRRTGTMIIDSEPNKLLYMDSRDVTWPFTPGALRGGTHNHEWSLDGKWVGFTYNDAIMKDLEDSTGVKWNMRTIGVANQQKPPFVDLDAAQENVQGTWYCAVVVRVVPNPKPGSDEISNAAWDSWIGASGYQKPDGSVQVARAFRGIVRSNEGKPVEELFVVDIPDLLNVPGEYGPLEGTKTSFPMPPKGTTQRRLTHTADTKYPGLGGVMRCSSDGKYISFLKRDDNGIQQVYLMSPLGGEAIQLTEHTSNVQSSVRWSPDDKSVIYVWDNSIVQNEISDKPFAQRFRRLTAKTKDLPLNVVWSNDGKTIAYNRLVVAPGSVEPKKQIFVIRLD